MSTKSVVLFSGGLDSATVLAQALLDGPVHCVIMDYGQRHSLEILAAKNIILHYGNLGERVSSEIVKLPASIFTGGILDKANMSPKALDISANTVVPFRNGVFISIATAIACAQRADVVQVGMYNEPGGFEFPDESYLFLSNMHRATLFGTDPSIGLCYPLEGLSKSEVISLAYALQVPIKLTRSCYLNEEKACGHCAACVKRLAAFALLGKEDQIDYI